MAELDLFERRLHAALVRRVGGGPIEFDAAAFAHEVAVKEPRRHGLGTTLRWVSPVRTLAWLALLALLLIALGAGLLVVGALRQTPYPALHDVALVPTGIDVLTPDTGAYGANGRGRRGHDLGSWRRPARAVRPRERIRADLDRQRRRRVRDGCHRPGRSRRRVAGPGPDAALVRRHNLPHVWSRLPRTSRSRRKRPTAASGRQPPTAWSTTGPARRGRASAPAGRTRTPASRPSPWMRRGGPGSGGCSTPGRRARAGSRGTTGPAGRPSTGRMQARWPRPCGRSPHCPTGRSGWPPMAGSPASTGPPGPRYPARPPAAVRWWRWPRDRTARSGLRKARSTRRPTGSPWRGSMAARGSPTISRTAFPRTPSTGSPR